VKKAAKTAVKKADAPKKPIRRRSKRRKPLSFEDSARAAILTVVCIIAAVCATIIVIGITRSAEEVSLIDSAPAAVVPESSISVEADDIPEALDLAPPVYETPPAVRTRPPATRETPPTRDTPPPRTEKPTSVRTENLPAARTKPAPTRTAVEVPKPVFVPGAPAQPPSTAVQPPKPALKNRGTVMLVIDDAGNNLPELDPFLRFPGPLTIAVLPALPYSAEAARRIRAAGKEVFLHQPMEAIGGQNPGPGALYSGMSAEEIRGIINQNIDEIGPIAGINNHQGSKITMDEKAMEVILSLCRERGIQFLDSRTTADTAAPLAAKRLGMTIGERDVFLDNEQDRAAMVSSVEAGLLRAANRGKVVMIGHTWSPELAGVLIELYPKLVEQGYSFSTVSRYMKGLKQ